MSTYPLQPAVSNYVGGIRPVLRRAPQNAVTLNALTGVTVTGASGTLDNTVTHGGALNSIKLISTSNNASNLVLDLQTILGAAVNMASADYFVIYVNMAAIPGGSEIHIVITDDGTFTNYAHKYCSPVAGQVNQWIPITIQKSAMASGGTGANWAAIRYVKLEAPAITGLQTTWWQSFWWLQPNGVQSNPVSGAGTAILSQMNGPVPYQVIGCTANPAVLDGLPCLQVVSAVNTDAIVRYDLGDGIDMTSPCVALRMWQDWGNLAAGNMQAQFYLSSTPDFSDMSGLSSGKYISNPGWNEVRWCWTENAGTLPGPVPKRYVQIKVPAIASIQNIFGIGDFIMDVASQPIVTLNFDDGDTSFYQYVWPLLQQFNLPATAFVIGSYIGTSGYMTAAQLQTMYASGLVDVCNHSWSHTNRSGDMVLSNWLNDYGPAINNLRSLGFTRNNCNKVIAYPNGAFTSVGWQALQQLGVLAARTVNIGPACIWSYPHTPLALADDYESSSGDSLATVQAAVMTATKIGATANLTFHVVVASGATGSQTNLAQLASVLAWLAQQQAGNALKVKTIAQVIAGN